MQESFETVVADDPFALFSVWFAEATRLEPADPNAVVLATTGSDGQPTARTMLMKSYDKEGFVFYTNQESRKSQQLHANDKVGLCFYWKSLYRQIHIEGCVGPVSASESDEYFDSRPRQSQIGAWASQQSRPLSSRKELEDRIEALTAQYEGKPIPRPPHWGGYRVTPNRIEFWRGHEFRLHDRVVYSRPSAQENWTSQRIFP